METKDLMIARMTAPITAILKARYKQLAQDLGITEADLYRRAMAHYAGNIKEITAREQLYDNIVKSATQRNKGG